MVLHDSVELTREFFVSLGVPGLFVVGILDFYLPLVFPFPPIVVIIPLVLATPELAPAYVLAATAGSVVAGIGGYGIGLKGGRPVLESRFSEARIRRAEAYFDRNGFVTVFFGSFAPIPEAHELLSFASGVFDMSFRRYLLASVLGRGLKYVIVALIVVWLGEAARMLSEAELYSAIAVVTVVVLVAYVSRVHWLPEEWRRLAG